MKKKKRILLLFFLVLISVGYLIPQKKMMIPVEGATPADWNSESYWYYPWGRSVTHKGVDVFAKKGVKVVSSTCLKRNVIKMLAD